MTNPLTVSDVEKGLESLSAGIELFGYDATEETQKAFLGLKAETAKHYTRDEWSALPKDTVLPESFTKKYHEFMRVFEPKDSGV